jgi:hypothetical protein
MSDIEGLLRTTGQWVVIAREIDDLSAVREQIDAMHMVGVETLWGTRVNCEDFSAFRIV